MSEKQTFVNALDRLVWPHIAQFDDEGYLNADPASAYRPDGEEDELFKVYMGDIGPFTIRQTLQGDFVGTSLYWQSTLVYRRTDGGRTIVLRPGDWVLELLDWSYRHRLGREKEEARKALDQALARIPDFSPI